jgi:hypothetical protein
MESLWSSNSMSSSNLWDPIVSLVSMEALMSAPMMVMVFLEGKLLRNSEFRVIYPDRGHKSLR